MANGSSSFDADSTTIETLRTIAVRAGRTAPEIIAASLCLYLKLPAAMRVAFQTIEAMSSPEEEHNLIQAMARVIASAQYGIARRLLVEQIAATVDENAETNTDWQDTI